MLSLKSMARLPCALSSLSSPSSASFSAFCAPGVAPRRGSNGIGRIRCAAEGEPPAVAAEEDDFEARLAKLQRKVTSGTGKKAEARKARKEAGGDVYAAAKSASSKSSSDGIMLPPVALREPVSDGLQVEMGFNSYTERLNGRFAALGLAAVLLVELATGGSFLKYHDLSTLSTQVYVMLSAAALFVKLEKEKVSVWPKD